jgi:hypothetical protein
MPGPYRIDKLSLLDTLDGTDAVIADPGYGIQCVGLLKKYSKCGATGGWRQGALVKETRDIAQGTAIATFDKNAKYPSNQKGNHACFFIGFFGELGFWVLEQHVKPKPDKIQRRLIRYQLGEHISVSDNANCYRIIL